MYAGLPPFSTPEIIPTGLPVMPHFLCTKLKLLPPWSEYFSFPTQQGETRKAARW